MLVSDEHDRQVARKFRDSLGDDVEMLCGMQGQAYADLRRQIARPHAAGDDDLFRADFALLGHDADGLAAFDDDVLDEALFKDLGAAHARALCISHRYVDGIDLTVIGEPETADDAVDVYRRPAFLDLAGRNRFDRQAEIPSH